MLRRRTCKTCSRSTQSSRESISLRCLLVNRLMTSHKSVYALYVLAMYTVYTCQHCGALAECSVCMHSHTVIAGQHVSRPRLCTLGQYCSSNSSRQQKRSSYSRYIRSRRSSAIESRLCWINYIYIYEYSRIQ